MLLQPAHARIWLWLIQSLKTVRIIMNIHFVDALFKIVLTLCVCIYDIPGINLSFDRGEFVGGGDCFWVEGGKRHASTRPAEAQGSGLVARNYPGKIKGRGVGKGGVRWGEVEWNETRGRCPTPTPWFALVYSVTFLVLVNADK